MREIILDTETTGLDPATGDRVVEIGAVEVLNTIPTGNSFHVYINPERDMPEEAFRVHGLSAEFLSDKPVFAAVAEDFATFIGSDMVVAHNASFDIAFLNHELTRCGRTPIGAHQVVDTLAIARRKHSGSNSLDALCARYGIDASRRTKHGALLDAELLAEVYLELRGGRQATLLLAEDQGGPAVVEVGATRHRPRPAPLPPRISAAERAAHAAFMATFEEPLWQTFLAEEDATEAMVAAE
ncbi:DNA polymerase III subunit epsilon [Acuticoccus kandeliae]|uniref:DNA polymerase III subunit epsilon n=1 Tax=Acuticoccus kandeliae TaxID=2073160 RepID=UPI000D3E67BD|nr:DNA polymerase III subunit epsilon [Acuticoccus kandeliae]